MSIPSIRIGEREIGPGRPAYVIAEAGMNHNGDMDLAVRIIAAAAGAGADAVKFQSFRTSRLVGANAPDYDFRRSVELTPEQHVLLRDACGEHGVDFLSTPCDEDGVDLLVELGTPAIKVGSFDIAHLPLLRHIGKTRLPVLLSTGTAGGDEIADAIAALREPRGDAPIVLLHCISQYPVSMADLNLRAIGALAEAFALPVGFSDHTLGVEAAPLAAALGACVIEKHFTLDRALPGPDQAMSCPPHELAELVRRVRAAESALGDGSLEPLESERELARIARRSIVAIADIAAGQPVTPAVVDVLRPPTGLPPAELPRVLGATARVDIAAGTPLTWDMLDPA